MYRNMSKQRYIVVGDSDSLSCLDNMADLVVQVKHDKFVVIETTPVVAESIFKMGMAICEDVEVKPIIARLFA